MFCILYIKKCARCPPLMGVVVIHLYVQKSFLGETLLYTQKSKNQSFLCKEYIFKAQIPRALLSNKN